MCVAYLKSTVIIWCLVQSNESYLSRKWPLQTTIKKIVSGAEQEFRPCSSPETVMNSLPATLFFPAKEDEK